MVDRIGVRLRRHGRILKDRLGLGGEHEAPGAVVVEERLLAEAVPSQEERAPAVRTARQLRALAFRPTDTSVLTT
jgi:hypothetical protein